MTDLPGAQGEAVLVADVGGTNCRLAVGVGQTLIARANYLTRDFDTPLGALADFLSKQTGKRPTLAAFALACPVASETVRLTNSRWTFDRTEIEAAFDFRKLLMANDLVAQARAVSTLPSDQLKPIGRPRPKRGGCTAVVGAGTGLGVARIEGGPPVIISPSEAGHIGFSPHDELELKLLQILRRDLDRVTWEHMVSGPGLVRLYRALGALHGSGYDAIDGPTIVARAIADSDELCVEAANCFARMLASVAGDMALAYGAGQVVLVGAIANSLKPIMREDAFRDRFNQRGPSEDFLDHVDLSVAAEPDLGLIGAAALLRDASA